MVKREEKFAEEERTHGAQSPGVVQDDEELERRLPPGEREIGDALLPQSAFTRRDLQWTKADGGASVERSRYAQGQVSGRRGARGTVNAKAGDVRRLTDAEGNRLWSITDRPVPENRRTPKSSASRAGRCRAERSATGSCKCGEGPSHC